MPTFIYKAKHGPAQMIDGTIEAEHLDQAVRKITQLGYFPINVSVQTELKDKDVKKKPRASFLFRFRKKVSSGQIAIFTRQLYVLRDSGVPLLRSLRVILNQLHDPHFKAVVKDLADCIEGGAPFSNALLRHKDVFSQLYISMIKSGESSGELSLVLSRLADFTLKDQDIRSKIQASLYYPILVLTFGGLTVAILLTFVIPQLTVIFEDLNQSLPLPTAILIAVSNFFASFWWFLLGAGGAGIYFFKRFYNLPHGRLWVDRMKLHLPILGNFFREIELGRFARTLATLIKSGVVIVSALETVSEILENMIIKQELRKATQEVRNGSSLTGALSRSSYFPESALSIIAIGEESGRLDHGLNNLADSYERQTELSTQTVTSLLGPMMILMIGMVVGFIVVAMALPIFRMNLLIK